MQLAIARLLKQASLHSVWRRFACVRKLRITRVTRVLRNFSFWLRVVLSIPKNEWLMARSMSSEKRSITPHAFDSEIPPLNISEPAHPQRNNARRITVTHQSFSTACNAIPLWASTACSIIALRSPSVFRIQSFSIVSITSNLSPSSSSKPAYAAHLSPVPPCQAHLQATLQSATAPHPPHFPLPTP